MTHVAKGINRATLTVTPTKVIISRAKGRVNKEILIDQITSMEIRKAGYFSVGHIRFSFKGGQEHTTWTAYRARIDENAVMFKKQQEQDFIKAKELVERYQADASKQPLTSSSNVSDLEKLASLRDKGVITKEDFEAKKKQVLGI